jgi:hypothetical protein
MDETTVSISSETIERLVLEEARERITTKDWVPGIIPYIQSVSITFRPEEESYEQE